MVNARDLGPFITNGQFQPGVISAMDRARVIAFQTWLGLGDSQVLISVTSGRVLSIDHGECFGAVDALTDPFMVITDIPGVPIMVGKDLGNVRAAVDRIEAFTDQDIVSAVACVPTGPPWESTIDRRAAIGRWLSHRRGRLRGVMETWSQQ